ncbi:MAG: hypothetical protein JW384_03458 [Nitrosomonadaceae bacterium]|nr:hypothetical protein [Nitrosomonadaceae bacterium]
MLKIGHSRFLEEEAFKKKMFQARPGEAVIYFVGDLAYEDCTATEHENWKSMRATAKAAFTNSAFRRLYLTQRRVGPSKWEYLATKAMNY